VPAQIGCIFLVGCTALLLWRWLHLRRLHTPQKLHERVEQEVAARTAPLRRANQKLMKQIADCSRNADDLRRRTSELDERVKELNCLYRLSDLVQDQDLTLEHIAQQAVQLIPPAWQFPEVTCGRIELDGSQAVTEGFRETPWRMSARIRADDEDAGLIEVFYLQQMPDADEGPFLREERNLIEALAERLGAVVERFHAEETRLDLERRLHEARKTDALGRLAAGITHDFNNLLTVIRGHAERATSSLPSHHQLRQELKPIGDAVQQAATLTASLGTFTRTLRGTKERLDLRPILEECERLLRHVLPPQIKLEVSPPDGPLWLHADADQWKQLIMHLSLNARDALPEGGTLILAARRAAQVDTNRFPAEVPAVRCFTELRVSHAGDAPPSELSSISVDEILVRGHHGDGTGAGLAIVQGIVEEHGGYLDVKGAPGGGVEMRVVVPCAEPDPTTDDRPTPLRPQGNGEAILLAANEPHVRGILVGTLESLGYDVVHTDHAHAARDLLSLQRDRIQLLVLDVAMPDQSSVGCLTEMRQAGWTGPAVLLADQALTDAANLDANTFVLCRPFAMPELASVVRDLLNPHPCEEDEEEGEAAS
jgi:two-component system cell cycle sensor histidine kinase/response regulator CckA